MRLSEFGEPQIIQSARTPNLQWNLPTIFEGELDIPGWTCDRNKSSVALLNIGNRQEELRVVQGVEELGTELQLTPLPSHIKELRDRKSTRLNSSHSQISYAVFCLKKKHLA